MREDTKTDLGQLVILGMCAPSPLTHTRIQTLTPNPSPHEARHPAHVRAAADSRSTTRALPP
eukprot:797214-Prymnesium_polylepis.1